MSKCTSLGIDPCSLSGAWLAAQRARFRMSPITALTSGHRDGGGISLTMVGRPPCSLTAFWATCAIEKNCVNIPTSIHCK